MEKTLLTLLITLFTFVPSLQVNTSLQGAAGELPQHEETVYLTKEALQILNGEAAWLEDEPEPFRAKYEEGIIDMRYVILQTDKGEVFTGVRLMYPYPLDIDTVSLDTYKIVDYEIAMLYVSRDGVWGNPAKTGCYVFLVVDKPPLIASIWPAEDDPELAMYENDLHIYIWQEEQVTLTNGYYVLPHMLIATEGLYPQQETNPELRTYPAYGQDTAYVPCPEQCLYARQGPSNEQPEARYGVHGHGRGGHGYSRHSHSVRRDCRHIESVKAERPE